MEAMNLTLATGGVLEKAGVPVVFHTDDGITDSRMFLRSAAFSVRYGMSKEKAMEGLTIIGAKILDLSTRIGSLEKGKLADFVILAEDIYPEKYMLKTKVTGTYLEGIKK